MKGALSGVPLAHNGSVKRNNRQLRIGGLSAAEWPGGAQSKPYSA